jgi:hypothetical protein
MIELHCPRHGCVGARAIRIDRAKRNAILSIAAHGGTIKLRVGTGKAKASAELSTEYAFDLLCELVGVLADAARVPRSQVLDAAYTLVDQSDEPFRGTTK